jgi:type I restriction enzyme S subunit
VRLGDVLEVQSGFAFKKEYFSNTEGVPLIRIRDLDAEDTETKYNGPYREEFIVGRGDFLIGMDGEFRCHIWKGPRALLNQRVCRLRNFAPSLDPMYLYYGIQKYLSNIEAQTAFVTVKHISGRQIQSILMPLPSIGDQRRIVDLLSRAENIVRRRQEAEAKAKEIIPALFLDIFGDPSTNEKAWELRTIGDIASYTRYGPRFPDRKYAETGAHILRTTDMDTNGTVRWKEAPILPVTKDEAERFSLRPGTIVITRTGATIGKVALFRGADRPCIAGTYLIEVGTTDDVEPEFLLALLLSKYGQSALTTGSRAVAQPNLNAPTIRAIRVPIAPRALQATFARRCAQARDLCSQQSRATRIAEEGFKSLLANVFRQ